MHTPAIYDPERSSGRTTMAALHYVHLVLDNPGKEVIIVDHAPTIEADRQLFGLVCAVLNALRVPITAHKGRFTIRCDGPPQPYNYPSLQECLKSNQEWERDNLRLESRRGMRYIG